MYVVTKKDLKGLLLHKKYVSLKKKEENCSPQKN